MNKKIVVIGAGQVGSAIVYTLSLESNIDELILIDIDKEKALGEVLDITHSKVSYLSTKATCNKKNYDISDTVIRVGDYSDCQKADIIIITAGVSANRDEPGDRFEFIHANVSIMDSIMNSITKYTREAIVLVVSNPVDILSYYGAAKWKYPANLLFGTGTLLDTVRMKSVLSRTLDMNIREIDGYVLGEHGDSSLITWHRITANMDESQLIALNKPNVRTSVLKEVQGYGNRILQLKGCTNYGISGCVQAIVDSVLNNRKSILPVSVYMSGQYRLNQVALSVPCIVSRNGIESVVELELIEEEQVLLNTSAETLKAYLRQL